MYNKYIYTYFDARCPHADIRRVAFAYTRNNKGATLDITMRERLIIYNAHRTKPYCKIYANHSFRFALRQTTRLFNMFTV